MQITEDLYVCRELSIISVWNSVRRLGVPGGAYQ